MKIPERIAALRELMSADNLQAYLVPSADAHQSEYVADTWQRRRFLSGFDGSAGTVVVTADQAGLWTDSRYFVQGAAQLRGTGIDLFKMGEAGVPEIEPWLCEVLSKGDRVGFDPRVFSVSAHEKLKKELDPAGIDLVMVEADLVERVWADERPAMPDRPVREQPIEFAGETSGEKIERLQEALEDQGVEAQVVCALDEIAWLFNLRGADVAYNPVFIAYAVVTRDQATLFVDPAKLDDTVRSILDEKVRVKPYEEIGDALADLAREKAQVWIDPATVSHWVANLLESRGAEVIKKTSPVPGWKARKNDSEIAGMRAAHLRDGVTMVRFLHWLEETLSKGGLTEMDIVDKLKELRSEHPEFIGSSFGTISAYGPHGAIVHYRVSAESNVPLKPEGILLVDTGGQYQDGTTDITRTLALGEPSAEHKRAYTAVLKGHLALTRTWFAAGADGYQLDVVARAPLWSMGLNYGHGTGHGVGAALCVHEGPFSVSPRKVLVPLEAGNILSIEPGYYQEGAFGVRIENLALVVEREENPSGRFLGFETLTLCPYHRELIEPELLNPEECAQVDAYHRRVFETLGGLLDGPQRAWLESRTRPL